MKLINLHFGIYIIILAFLLMPCHSFAAIEKNLYYGLTSNNDVKELQQFLISKNLLSGNATGNYFSLTVGAVKKYQASKNISTTGYLGPLTRQAINSELLLLPTTSTNKITTQIPLKGTLDLLKNTLYSNQSIFPPQLNFKLADFTLKNNTTETINLKKIQVDLAIDSDLYSSNMYVNKLYVVYEENKTIVLDSVSHNNFWIINYNLPANKTINFTVYGDINSLMPLNSSVNSSMLITGSSTTSNNAIGTNLNDVLPGQSMTFGTGSLTVSKDGATQDYKMVIAGQRVVAGKFQFKSDKDSYTISELKFIIPNSLVASLITGAVLSDSVTKTVFSTKPVLVTYDGTNYNLKFIPNIPIALNETKSIAINYDLNAQINSNNSNIDITPVLVYVKAVNSTGKVIDGAASIYANISSSYGGIVLPSMGITATELTAFKSIPTFISNSSNSRLALNNEVTDIYRFSISADKNADISVKQLKFIVKLADADTSNPRLNYFKLFKGDKDFTNSAYIGTVIDDIYIGLASKDAIGVGIDNVVVITFIEEEVVLAGKTQEYTIKATTNGFSKSATLASDSITTYMPADDTSLIGGRSLKVILKNVYYGLAKSPSDIFATKYNLLWSDRSTLFPNVHSNLNSAYTNDWYNGYNILNLPLSSQTVTAK